MLELYGHNIVLWKIKLKMAINIAQFVDMFYNEEENINLGHHIDDIVLSVTNRVKSQNVRLTQLNYPVIFT